MPMGQFFTFYYLLNSFKNGQREFKQIGEEAFEMEEILELLAENGFEPSQQSINAILSFAQQFEVFQSSSAGIIELNLN
jgi:hypothetical protein